MENRRDIIRILNTPQNDLTTDDITIIEVSLNNYHNNLILHYILHKEYGELYEE